MIKLVFIVFVMLSSVSASYLSPDTCSAIISKGIDYVILQEYDSALTLFSSNKEVSEEKRTILDFCRIMTLEAIMIDYESNLWEKEYDSLSQRLENLLHQKIKQVNKEGWPRFYLGALLITKGAHQIRFARYFDFTKSMLSGMGYIRRAYQLDSSIVDAALYLSLYDYAKSRLISWLPGVDDGSETAIAFLENAAKRGFFTKAVAAQALVTLYAESGKWDSAKETADKFCIKYPTNRAMRWMLGKAAYSGDNFDLARKCFNELIPLIDKIPEHYPYNVLSLHWHLASLDYETGNFKEARERCDLITGKYGSIKLVKKEQEIFEKLIVLGNKARRKE
jgi:tetratricopeptide (TPR) repeat protein